MILVSGTYGKILLSTMKLMSKNINATDGRARSGVPESRRFEKARRQPAN